MKMYEGVEVQFRALLVPALQADEGSASRCSGRTLRFWGL